MLRRLVCASVIGLAVAASTVTGALAASAANVATPSTEVTTQTATPSFECVPGIVSTVCGVVFGPLCKNGCYAATQTQTPAAAPATTTTAPALFCQPQFQILCTVLGLTLCRTHPCGADVATASPTAQPRFTSLPGDPCTRNWGPPVETICHL